MGKLLGWPFLHRGRVLILFLNIGARASDSEAIREDIYLPSGTIIRANKYVMLSRSAKRSTFIKVLLYV